MTNMLGRDLQYAELLLKHGDLGQAVLLATEIITTDGQTTTREMIPGPGLIHQAFLTEGQAFVEKTMETLSQQVFEQNTVLTPEEVELMVTMRPEELEPDALTLIADAALKEMARNDCALLQNSAFNDPDLLEDLRSISSMSMPNEVYRDMNQVVVEKQIKTQQAHQKPGQKTSTTTKSSKVATNISQKPKTQSRTDRFLSNPAVREHFEDCMEGLQEIRMLVNSRFDDPNEADRVFEQGLEKAFAASAKTMDAKNRLQKIQNTTQKRGAL